MTRNDRWVTFPKEGPSRREYLVGAARPEECVETPDEEVSFTGGYIRRSAIRLDGRLLGYRTTHSILGVENRYLTNASGTSNIRARYDVNGLLMAARSSGIPLPEPEPQPEEREQPETAVPEATDTAGISAITAVVRDELAHVRAEVSAARTATAELEESRQRLGDAIREARQFRSGVLVGFPTWARTEDAVDLAEHAVLAGKVDRAERRVESLRQRVRVHRAKTAETTERLRAVPVSDPFGVCNGEITWVRESLARSPGPVTVTDDRMEWARHESRHAIATILVGGEVERVTVGHEVVESGGGTHEREGCCWDRTPIAPKGWGDYGEAFSLIAGGSWSDMQEAMRLYHDTGKVWRHVQQTFARPDVSAAVERLARRLYKQGSLTGAEVLQEVER